MEIKSAYVEMQNGRMEIKSACVKTKNARMEIDDGHEIMQACRVITPDGRVISVIACGNYKMQNTRAKIKTVVWKSKVLV